MNLVDLMQRKLSKFLGVQFFRERKRADQMMRRFCKRSRVRLGCEHIEAVINLKSVGTNDFGVTSTCNLRGQFRLARGRRSDEKKNAFHLVGTHRSLR